MMSQFHIFLLLFYFSLTVSFLFVFYFLGHGADVKCVDWHPQKSLIASGSKDNQQPIKLWDPKSGQSLATM